MKVSTKGPFHCLESVSYEKQPLQRQNETQRFLVAKEKRETETRGPNPLQGRADTVRTTATKKKTQTISQNYILREIDGGGPYVRYTSMYI